MNDELFMQIMELPENEKLELMEALQQQLAYAGEGMHFGDAITLSGESQMELIMREAEIKDEKPCLIHFDDHVLYLQKLTNA